MKGALLFGVFLVAVLAVGWWNFDVAATTPHSPWVEALLHETVLQEKLRALKPFWQLLVDRLPDHARAGESDQSLGLRKNDIS